MTTDARAVLERFHRTLVDEIREQRPEYLTGPFTVAEIYQNLVPYRTHRDRIGVEMNGDYEDALLRLLAGEGGYLVLDSEPALRDLREELASPNPNTGLYREFAAVDVRLGRARLESADFSVPAPSRTEAPKAEEPTWAMDELAPLNEEPAAAEPTPPAPRPTPSAATAPDPAADPAPATRAGASGAGQGSCRWCRAELPDRPDLNFCPFCGTDVHVVPCPACSQELEPEWRFCISCGVEVSG